MLSNSGHKSLYACEDLAVEHPQALLHVVEASVSPSMSVETGIGPMPQHHDTPCVRLSFCRVSVVLCEDTFWWTH